MHLRERKKERREESIDFSFFLLFFLLFNNRSCVVASHLGVIIFFVPNCMQMSIDVFIHACTRQMISTGVLANTKKGRERRLRNDEGKKKRRRRETTGQDTLRQLSWSFLSIKIHFLPPLYEAHKLSADLVRERSTLPWVIDIRISISIYLYIYMYIYQSI